MISALPALAFRTARTRKVIEASAYNGHFQLKLVGPDQLPADFAILVGWGVNIEIPTPVSEVASLGSGNIGRAFERTSEGARSAHLDRSVLLRCIADI